MYICVYSYIIYIYIKQLSTLNTEETKGVIINQFYFCLLWSFQIHLVWANSFPAFWIKSRVSLMIFPLFLDNINYSGHFMAQKKPASFQWYKYLYSSI